MCCICCHCGLSMLCVKCSPVYRPWCRVSCLSCSPGHLLAGEVGAPVALGVHGHHPTQTTHSALHVGQAQVTSGLHWLTWEQREEVRLLHQDEIGGSAAACSLCFNTGPCLVHWSTAGTHLSVHNRLSVRGNSIRASNLVPTIKHVHHSGQVCVTLSLVSNYILYINGWQVMQNHLAPPSGWLQYRS